MSHERTTPEEVRAQFPDPRDRAWFDRWLAADRKAQRAEALREAAETYGTAQITYMGTPSGYVRAWLRDRADRIEAGDHDGS